MSGTRNSLTRRVITAIGLLGSAQAVNIACSVIRNKFMAIWVGPAGVGLNSILVNASTLVSTATQLSMRDSAVRDLSTPMPEAALALKTAAVRRWSLLLGLLGAVAAIMLAPVLSAMAYGGSFDYWHYFALLAPAVFFGAYSAGEMAILQSCDRLKDLARANLISGIIATVISLPLIYRFRLGSIVYVIDIYAASLAATVFFMREPATRAPYTPNLDLRTLWLQGKSFLSVGLVISVSVLLTSFTNYIFSAYINSTGGEAALGTYQSGYTLVNSYVGIIFSAIAVEYYPRLTRFLGRKNMARTVMAHEVALVVKLVTPIAIVFIIFSDFLIRLLYSSSFDAIRPFVNLAVLGALFRGVSLCFAYRILAAGDTKAYLFTESLSVTLGLSLNIAGYHFWSYTGLGVSYILWYLSYVLITAFTCRHRYAVSLPPRIWRPITAATLLITITIAIKFILS